MKKPVVSCASVSALVVLSLLTLPGCGVEITGVDPECGVAGETATVYGRGLSRYSTDLATLTVGGIEAEVTSATPITLTFVVPDGVEAGPVNIVATAASGKQKAVGWEICGTQDLEVARIEITPAALVLAEQGETYQLTAQAYNAADEAIPADFTWSSSAPEQVAVDASGLVTAIASVGSSVILAMAGDIDSNPVIVAVASPVAGATFVADAQIADGPELDDPNEEGVGVGTRLRVTLQNIDAPFIGDILLAREASAVNGRVLEVVDLGDGSVSVLYELIPISEMYTAFEIDVAVLIEEDDWVFPDDLLESWDVEQDADGAYTLTPKPVQQKVDVALFGFECKADVGIPLTFLPPSFKFQRPIGEFRVQILDSSKPRVFKLVSLQPLQISFTLAPKLTAAFAGAVTCKRKIYELPNPLQIPLLGGVLPGVGFGFELAVTTTVGEVGFQADVTGTYAFEAGWECPPEPPDQECDFATGGGDFDGTELKPILPDLRNNALGQSRIELNRAMAGAFADLRVGVSRFNPLGFANVELIDSWFGAALEGSFATSKAQVLDLSYKSNYSFGFVGFTRAGSTTKKVLGLLNLKALKLMVEWFRSNPPIYMSPDAIQATTSLATFDIGDPVNFDVELFPNDLEFFGVYNVDSISIFYKEPTTGDVTEKARQQALPGETRVVVPWTADFNGAIGDHFFAFASTNLLAGVDDLELTPVLGGQDLCGGLCEPFVSPGEPCADNKGTCNINTLVCECTEDCSNGEDDDQDDLIDCDDPDCDCDCVPPTVDLIETFMAGGAVATTNAVCADVYQGGGQPYSSLTSFSASATTGLISCDDEGQVSSTANMSFSASAITNSGVNLLRVTGSQTGSGTVSCTDLLPDNSVEPKAFATADGQIQLVFFTDAPFKYSMTCSASAPDLAQVEAEADCSFGGGFFLGAQAYAVNRSENGPAVSSATGIHPYSFPAEPFSFSFGSIYTQACAGSSTGTMSFTLELEAIETICNDELDDECDGLIDCDDPDCFADPWCGPTGFIDLFAKPCATDVGDNLDYTITCTGVSGVAAQGSLSYLPDIGDIDGDGLPDGGWQELAIEIPTPADPTTCQISIVNTSGGQDFAVVDITPLGASVVLMMTDCPGACDGVSCDDMNLCTTDGQCDPATGMCPPKVVISCDDGNACTTDGVCDLATGQCPPKVSKNCDDGEECTDDDCRPSDAVCLNPPKPNGTQCSIGTCQSGICDVCTGFACTEAGIRAAISALGTSQTICCLGGPVVNTTSEIVIDNDVVISVVGDMIVDAGGTHRAFSVDPGINAELRNVVVTNGGGVSTGAGILNNGNLTLVDSTVTGNAATLQGGGVFNAPGAMTTLNRSTVASNTADNGGGLYNASGGTLTLVNSTVSGNDAVSQGGGLVNDGTLNLTSVTFAENLGGAGSAVYNAGTATITDTLISGDCSGTQGPVSNGGNLESPGQTCALFDPTDQRDIPTPLLALGALGENGGLTQTHKPDLTSPAIDGAGPMCVNEDQRGVLRPIGPACDVGAVEVSQP